MGALLDHGVMGEDISVVFHESYNRATATGDGDDAENIRKTAEKGITTTTVDDAAVGAAKGAGIGLGVGALAALASVVVPGFGIVLGGGALAASIAGLVGTTAAGAVAGGAAGWMMDQGVPEERAKLYTETIGRGGAVLSVSVPSNDVSASEVEQVLAKYQAEGIGNYAGTH